MPGYPPLADPADLARWVDRDATDEAVIRAVIGASARFRNAVRHPVSHVAGDTIWLDGNGGTTLLLPAAPVTAVTTVEVRGVAVTDYTWSRKGILHRACGWPREYNGVKVVYSHGYITIPEEITDAVITEARYLFDLQPGVSSMTVGGESVSYSSPIITAGAMPAAWITAVDNFRLNHGDHP